MTSHGILTCGFLVDRYVGRGKTKVSALQTVLGFEGKCRVALSMVHTPSLLSNTQSEEVAVQVAFYKLHSQKVLPRLIL